MCDCAVLSSLSHHRTVWGDSKCTVGVKVVALPAGPSLFVEAIGRYEKLNESYNGTRCNGRKS